MAKKILNIDEFLPYRLSLATNTVSKELAKVYEPYDLTRTQWRILAVLSGGAMTAGDISSKTMMDKTTLSRAIKNLIDRKLLTRRAAQADGRSSPLALTAKGRRLFGKIAPLALAREAQVREKLSAADIKSLERILGVLLTKD